MKLIIIIAFFHSDESVIIDRAVLALFPLVMSAMIIRGKFFLDE